MWRDDGGRTAKTHLTDTKKNLKKIFSINFRSPRGNLPSILPKKKKVSYPANPDKFSIDFASRIQKKKEYNYNSGNDNFFKGDIFFK